MAGPSPHLVHLFETFDLGEAQLRTARLIGALGVRYRHTIVTMDRQARARRLIPEALDVGVIGPPDGRWVGLRRLLRLIRPDLILLSARERVSAFLAAARLDVPVLLQIDGADVDAPLGPPLLGHHLLRRVAAVATPSERGLASIQATFDGLRIPVTYVPAGVAVGTAPRTVMPRLQRPPGEVAIGMMVPPGPAPGLRTILRAFRDAPNHRAAHLVLFGGGPALAPLADEAERLDVVDRLVFVEDAVDPAALAREVDLFAVAESGGMGRHLLLEAMAAGLPVIGIAGSDLQSLVAADNREFLVQPDQRPALAAKMDALLRSSQLRRRLGRSNLDRARELPLAATVAGYDHLLGQLLERDPAERAST